MYGVNDYRDYLEHHQRKGAHWGIMNGPPYPLNKEGLASFKANLDEKKKQNKRVVSLKKARKVKARNAAEREKQASAEAAKKQKEEADIKKKSTTMGRTPLKEIKKMSTQEIQARISRLEMEKKLRDLESNDTSRGKKIIEDAMMEAGKKLLTDTIYNVGTKIIKESLGDDYVQKSNEQKKKK